MSLPLYAPIPPGQPVPRAVATSIVRRALMAHGVHAVCENPTATSPHRRPLWPTSNVVIVRSALVDGDVVTGLRSPSPRGEPRRTDLPMRALCALMDVIRERGATLRANACSGVVEVVWP